jgi:glycosyltransferase involved in cell wall biosynthesis
LNDTTNKNLRVLMVDSENTWRGGEAQMLLLMKGLLSEGQTVELAAPRKSVIRERSRELDIPFFPVSINGGLDLLSAGRLRRIIDRGRYDVVHSHSSHAHSVAFMACAMKTPRPYQVVSRRVDFDVATNSLSGLKYRYGADVFLAVSNGVRDVLVKCGVPDRKIRVVHDGIDLSRFEHVGDNTYVKNEFGITGETPVVGNIAALAPHKSQVDLVRAASIVKDRVPEAKFLIVGEGKLRGRLEKLIRELGLEGTVILTGFREDPLEILSTFTCFVLSSYLEGLGSSLLDAHAMRIPVVATDTGGIPDIVEDGKTGLLVPPRDPEALAGAILRLLADDRLRENIAKSAFTQSRGYDYRSMVYKTITAYRQLTGAST